MNTARIQQLEAQLEVARKLELEAERELKGAQAVALECSDRRRRLMDALRAERALEGLEVLEL